MRWCVKALCCVVLFCAGCGISTYPYRVMNDECACEIFHVSDVKARVAYTFSAVYSLDGEIVTRITVSLQNNSDDTLDLSLAYFKVSSRNVPYRYNGKSLPVDLSDLPPGGQHMLTLKGEVEETGNSSLWKAIAGEELVVTLKGLRINRKAIATQVIRFVPHNPKLSS